ncbi:hypothetical protein KP509_1Z070000 [Ceratopteris richardii]|nr:hypothetical protein KP509_1Z070000 [Ceratopteris richardii]
MQQELAENWGIKATVLYDRAPSHFHPTSMEEKHELFHRLGLHHRDGQHGSTLFTDSPLYSENDIAKKRITAPLKATLKQSRPALIISSTSWTADEDFSILLEAAVCYDRRVDAVQGEVGSQGAHCESTAASGPFPSLYIIVTGKGPLRERYERQIQKLRLNHVTFQTMWVSSKDYPLLLGSADLGVCLHTSSSGLDLPMKVVDMFGCGLPVCAVSYSCIHELVKDGENGLLFGSSSNEGSSSQLANQFLELFKCFPEDCKLLNKLRKGALASGSSSRWDDEWAQNVLPLVKEFLGSGGS